MFQLLLIRHGQSQNNALPEKDRVPDPGLTELGKRQAIALAQWLTDYRPTVLLCSGFRRALETTQPIAEALGIAPHVHNDLFEQGGCYEGYLPGLTKPYCGLGRTQIVASFGDWSIDERITDNGWYHGRDLESDAEATLRAERVVRWIEAKWLDHTSHHSSLVRPALVIHADFKALLLAAFLKRSDIRHTEAWNASVSQLSYHHGEWWLDFWNSIGHLPADHWSS